MTEIRKIPIGELLDVARASVTKVRHMTGKIKPFEVNLYGVPRGGIPVVFLLMAYDLNFNAVDDPEEADIIVDDLLDSGATRGRYGKKYPKIPFFPLFNKEFDSRWIVFPWEISDQDMSATDIPTRLIQYIGEDPTRGGLIDTPDRFLKAWKEKTVGYDQDPSDIMKVFTDGAESYDEMIIVKDIEIESVCEHHLERIWGVAHIAYIPDGKIVGLSKMFRLAEIFSRRLQVQERLTSQIAESLENILKPKGVGVVIEARHACMESRGICRRGQTTITSALKGVFKNHPETRAEFLKLATTKKEL